METEKIIEKVLDSMQTSEVIRKIRRLKSLDLVFQRNFELDSVERTDIQKRLCDVGKKYVAEKLEIKEEDIINCSSLVKFSHSDLYGSITADIEFSNGKSPFEIVKYGFESAEAYVKDLSSSARIRMGDRVPELARLDKIDRNYKLTVFDLKNSIIIQRSGRGAISSAAKGQELLLSYLK